MAAHGNFSNFGQRPGLFELPALRVTELTGDEFGTGLSRKQLAKAADNWLRSIQQGEGLLNEDTGWLLRVNKKGRSKMGDNPDMSANDSKAVAGLHELTRWAVLAERHVDDTHQNEFVAAVYRFYAPLRVAGQACRVKLTVKEYKSGAGVAGRMLHALSSVEIENAPLGTLPASTYEKQVLQQAQPTTGRFVSVRELLRGAQRHDGSPFAQEPPPPPSRSSG